MNWRLLPVGQINVEGVGAVQIQGDTPTPEEAQRIISAVMGLGKRQPDKTVIEDVSGGPFLVRTPAGQLKIPLREKGIGGPGFDPDAIPDPTLDENLEIPSGRGLLLMRAYMRSVEFNAVGNVVQMVYRRPPDDASDP